MKSCCALSKASGQGVVCIGNTGVLHSSIKRIDGVAEGKIYPDIVTLGYVGEKEIILHVCLWYNKFSSLW